jgi:citrate synthase
MSDAKGNPNLVHEGLEGVVVTRTRLSHVDGEQGRLIVAGHAIEDWAGRVTFEQACEVLWAESGRTQTPGQVKTALEAARAQAFAGLATLGDALTREHAMDALRASLAHLPEHSTPEQLVAAAAVYTAAHQRVRNGLAPIAPPAGRSHAEALLVMLGAELDPARARALDAYLVTVLDHGLNASTFAARVVASTQSDLVSAVVAGVGALKGPLHGGAPGPVLEMLAAIGQPEAARAFIERELAAGKRIMGMGHRIYRQRDPRAFVLERALAELERALADRPETAGTSGQELRDRLALARVVESEAEAVLSERYPGRHLKANVEFYTAVLLSAVGVDASLFSAIFACARSGGWIAHYSEQQRTGRLIRPSAEYIGTLPR